MRPEEIGNKKNRKEREKKTHTEKHSTIHAEIWKLK